MQGATRREFLAAAAMAGGAVALGGATKAARAQNGGASRPLKILVLGGTRFVGLHFVEAALERGHEVSCFTRGRSNPDIFKGRGVEMLVGNRDPDVDEGLSALEGREWDAVFDTTSYVKRIAEAAANTLKGNVGRYINISSVSVYAEQGKHGLTENDPVATIEDESTENVGQAYGALKAICERTFTEAFGDGATNIRPGFIVGPEDYMMQRFPLWVARIQRGGELIAPGDPNDGVQLIDARDIADFSMHCIENGVGGDFNLVGPASKLPTEQLCHGLSACVSQPPDWTWVDADFLEEKGLIPVPWVPSQNTEYGGLASVSNEKAKAAGLTFRSLAQTTLDTMAWLDGVDAEARQAIDGFFEAGTEQELLAEWKERQSG